MSGSGARTEGRGQRDGRSPLWGTDKVETRGAGGSHNGDHPQRSFECSYGVQPVWGTASPPLTHRTNPDSHAGWTRVRPTLAYFLDCLCLPVGTPPILRFRTTPRAPSLALLTLGLVQLGHVPVGPHGARSIWGLVGLVFGHGELRPLEICRLGPLNVSSYSGVPRVFQGEVEGKDLLCPVVHLKGVLCVVQDGQAAANVVQHQPDVHVPWP
mmetsp:Transcript_129600/g.223952  ORF Transcript_129600/g.223952 Transcript_129600/m.223952 type:complete len:212 (+) Transcript_129600:1272-1907(+)